MSLLSQLTTVLSHPNNKSKELYTIFLLAWWKMNQLIFKIPAVVSLVDGVQLICYPQSSYGSFVVYSKMPEYFEMMFFHSIISDDDTVFDVGANIGALTVLAAHKCPKGKVYAFEPTPQLLKYLHQNIRLNDFAKRVEVYQQAVSDSVGNCSFSISSQSEVNHLDWQQDRTEKSITVPAITIDSFCKKMGIAQINILKIDVEGAEPLVFSGAKKMLSSGSVDICMFEMNKNITHFGSSSKQLLQLISKKYFIFEFNDTGFLQLVSHNKQFTQTSNLIAVKKHPSAMKRVLPYLQNVTNTHLTR